MILRLLQIIVLLLYVIVLNTYLALVLFLRVNVDEILQKVAK